MSISNVKIVTKTAEITLIKTVPTSMATMALTAPYCIAVIPKAENIKIK